MPSYKRKRVTSRKAPYAKRAKRARTMGRTGMAGMLRASVARANKGVARLTHMIETKEGQVRTSPSIHMPHNNTIVLNADFGGAMNPFYTANGTADPMSGGGGQRIGDSIAIKGVSVKFMVENELKRPKVYYRFMMIRCAKGDTIDRSTLFKGDANNKMLDQINTKRFTVITQKIFNVTPTNAQANLVNTLGEPYYVAPVTGTPSYNAGTASKIVKIWVPGRKFGRAGVIQYENLSAQVKFYDYRYVFVCYDWGGTPQDVNNVGQINEFLSKVYYKDA